MYWTNDGPEICASCGRPADEHRKRQARIVIPTDSIRVEVTVCPGGKLYMRSGDCGWVLHTHPGDVTMKPEHVAAERERLAAFRAAREPTLSRAKRGAKR